MPSEATRHRTDLTRQPAPADAPNLLSADDGMISFMTVISILFLLILSALVANVALTVNEKMEVQSGADSVAYSTSLMMARGMNAVTAANHLMGELQALVILQHALGGPEADPQPREPAMKPGEAATVAELDAAFVAAQLTLTAQPSTDIYRDTRKRPRAGATIHDSVVRLQQVLAWTYEAMAAGGALQDLGWVPYVGPALYEAGSIILMAARTFERKVGLERKILEYLEDVAHATAPIKKACEGLIAVVYFGYAKRLEWTFPSRAKEAVASIAGANVMDSGTVFPQPLGLPREPFLRLPIEAEPEDLAQLPHSQLVRSSFPWVNHWRVKLLKLMRDVLRLARTSYYYKYYTNLYTLEKANEMKTERHVNLHIMTDTDLDGLDKGREPWVNDSDRADELFCVIGFSYRSPPTIAGPGIYSNPNEHGLLGFAQGMIYNANPQQAGGGAWDTLNWNSTVLEHNMNGGNTSDEPSDQPQIRVNWQAKLVPVTRLNQSVTQLPSPYRGIVFRLLPHSDQFRTH